jgi:hypothetical protein
MVIAVLWAASAAFCAVPDPCSHTSTVTDAQVSLAIAGGRNTFREGEIIPLELSFTSTSAKRYWADNRNSDRSGRLNSETYCVEPAARDPLADYFRGGSFLGGGLGSERQLSEEPFTATAELNEWRQPGPGHYRLYVVSYRVWRPKDPGEQTPYDRVPITLRSNTVDFVVTEADEDWRAQQLLEATEAYRNTATQREGARGLRFLNTRASTQTLARFFWGSNDQPGGWDLMFGLIGSPFRSEAIAAMQREIENPDHPITEDFLRTLVKLQIGADPQWQPPEYDPAKITEWREYWKKRQEHESELMRDAVGAAARALPHKSGQAHALTAEALSRNSGLLGPADASQMRRQLVAGWKELPDSKKMELIQYRWAQIGGPEMLPALVDFISRPAPPYPTMESMARDAALRHIYELDPLQGRELILRELRNPKAQPAISLVKLLSAEEVRPELSKAVERIEKGDARDLDFHLVEVFADKSFLPRMQQVFNRHLGQWACSPQSAMLRYFLNLDPRFGMEAVRASLGARKTTGCYRFLLRDLGSSLPKVESLAIFALDDADLEVENDAALALGSWGTAKAEAALWDRLKRFHQEWKDREDQLRLTPDYNSPIARSVALESTLVNSIGTGTGWICGPEKLDRLQELALPRDRPQITAWSQQWENGDAVILANWLPDDAPRFQVLQYSNLDEEQLRAKLSQIPARMKLYFGIWQAGHIHPPVSIEKQRMLLERLRSEVAQFGISIEEKSQ